MKENGERKLRGNCRPCIADVQEVCPVQTEADICSESREDKKETKIRTYYKG